MLAAFLLGTAVAQQQAVEPIIGTLEAAYPTCALSATSICTLSPLAALPLVRAKTNVARLNSLQL